MRIAESTIADLIDRVGGVYSYAIDYDSRRVFLTTMSGERIEMTFDDILRWVVERMKQNVVH